MKPILISGIQPSGRLHLGNYLGALKNFVDLQNSGKYQCYFFIADYHSLTESFNPKEKRQQVINLLADYLAVGLDLKKSVIFIQSHISAHTELAWILNTITPFGELSRMTQFKEKILTQPKNINAGLFNYPVLMAADVLLYDASFVPVGEDQLQHLELTRMLARKFNQKFGEVFTEPQPILTKTPRVMSLDNPTKKMSKSQPGGCLFIDDLPKEMERKIMSAVTDSGKEVKYNLKNKPGISNLLLIYAELSDKPLEKAESEFVNKNYSDFKKTVAKTVSAYFSKFQKNKGKLLKNTKKLLSVANAGDKIADKSAENKIAAVKKKLGLIT